MNNISQELLARASNGDMGAFEEIYKASSGFVYNVCLRITQDIPDAEEATQDVFLKIHRNLKDFAFRSSFKTWIYRIAVNAAINRYRVSARNRGRYLSYDEGSGNDAFPVESQVYESADKEERKAMVDSLLSSLSAELRSCIVLREIEGMDYKEIARTLDIPINTVRSRLKRAREKLLIYAAGGGGRS
ncbi:MAG: RNA polymerase sigma factor [Candidatus Omnitrophota bacterium]|nr:RNA polymerase sigma factor [Candidatus Omnitrophota bacterium]